MAATRPKVLITRKIPKEGLELLAKKCDLIYREDNSMIPRHELLEKAKTVNAIYCHWPEKIDRELIDAAPKLKVVATMSVGIDHLDIAECKKRGVKLGYTPGVLTESVAELTIALLLCTTRRLVEGVKTVNEGTWGQIPDTEVASLWMCGRGIQSSTVGIVGLGRIGYSVAKKLRAFEPSNIIYYDIIPSDKASEIGVEQVTFDELLEKSDFVIVNCALSDKTTHLFNKEAFSKMKSTATIINTSRGPVIEQEALYEALKNGQIGRAGLDVCYPEPLPKDHKLLKLDKCGKATTKPCGACAVYILVVLPHIGSGTIETRVQMAEMTSNNILNALDGKNLVAEVV